MGVDEATWRGYAERELQQGTNLEEQTEEVGYGSLYEGNWEGKQRFDKEEIARSEKQNR